MKHLLATCDVHGLCVAPMPHVMHITCLSTKCTLFSVYNSHCKQACLFHADDQIVICELCVIICFYF